MPYGIGGGTALANGQDYVFTGGTLYFDPGQTTKNLTLTIIDDSVAELTESVWVNLYVPTNAILGSEEQYIFYILDNDS